MTVRQANRLRRNDRIRHAFRQRYTDAPRPRKFSREYVLAQLADEFCLAVATVEDIIYAKREPAAGASPAAPAAASAGAGEPAGSCPQAAR